ncbi:MAG: gluconokinase [Caldilineae bacterium]|nr:gluconokinase [Caldilineae bacterium]
MKAIVSPQHAESPLVLALDIGSSSVRAALYDRLGRAVSGVEARRGHQLQTDSSGAAVADADELVRLTCQCIDETLDRAGALADDIAAVAGCSFVGNLLGVDRDGRPVTPLFTYADTRAAADAELLKQTLDEERCHQRTGVRFHPSYGAVQLHWLQRERPKLFGRAARWVSLGEYLETALFGQGGTSHSVASWSGLLDRQTLGWDEELLAALRLRPDKLPRLVKFSSPRDGLLPEVVRRWPALNNARWFPLIGDGAAANLGSGCVSPGRIALTMGTSTALRAVTGDSVERLPAGLWCYRVDERRSLPGGALTEGGSVYAWLNQSLQLPASEELEAILAQGEPDGHGLTVLPFLSGERAPGWAGHARATIHGLTLATRPADIVRASLEAVAYRIALVYDDLRALLPGQPQIVVSGGALASSPAWLQVVADALGRPLTLSAAPEASARGAALLALETISALPGIDQAPDFLGATAQPDMQRHEIYRRAIARQQELYDRLVDPL